MRPAEHEKLAASLRAARVRLRSGRGRVIVPELIGLHRRRPDAYFHSWPELFVQTGGATEFECPSGKFRLSSGNFCVMPAGVPHAETPSDPTSAFASIIFMQIGADCLMMQAHADNESRIRADVSIRLAGGNIYLRCLEQAALHGEWEDALREDYVRALVDAFLSAMLAMLLKPNTPQVEERPFLASEAEKLIRLSVADPSLTVASLSRKLACSPDHLTRVFRCSTGIVPSVWIARERVRLACELLETSPHNVSEIGWTCGFNTPSYFIRVFRAHTGVTPRSWREKPALRISLT